MYISHLHLILLMVTRFEKFKSFSFWCLFKTIIPLKMLQTFRRTHFTNTLKSNLNKKKKNDHRSFNIFPKKIFRRRCEKFTSSGPVTNNRYTFFEQNWTILISPRETKNSLESKNSAYSARQSSPSSHETAEKKAIHPKISSFLLTCSNLRRVFLRSIFSSFLFFFFFFSSFPCSCCVSQRRSFYISRVPTRRGQLFELSTTLKARVKRTRERGQYSSRFFDDDVSLLVELVEWNDAQMGMLEIENSSDARQGNPWNSSIVALPRIFLSQGC